MWCLRRDFRMHKTVVSCEGLCRAAGCTWCDAPATPAERRRKAKPKGKAAFNLHFKLFLGSRWEDGDLFCSLDPHFQNSRGCRSAEWPSRQEHPHVQWVLATLQQSSHHFCVSLHKLASRSSVLGADRKEVVRTTDYFERVRYKALSLTWYVRMCQVTLMLEMLCGLTWGERGEEVWFSEENS